MATASEPNGLLSIHDTAKRLGLCRTTVYELISAGDLPTVKLRSRVLVDPSDLDDLIRRRRRPASYSGTGYHGTGTNAYFGGTDQNAGVTP